MVKMVKPETGKHMTGMEKYYISSDLINQDLESRRK
jgi:hypothetical protein